jgi:hypothetical protein
MKMGEYYQKKHSKTPIPIKNTHFRIKIPIFLSKHLKTPHFICKSPQKHPKTPKNTSKTPQKHLKTPKVNTQ